MNGEESHLNNVQNWYILTQKNKTSVTSCKIKQSRQSVTFSRSQTMSSDHTQSSQNKNTTEQSSHCIEKWKTLDRQQRKNPQVCCFQPWHNSIRYFRLILWPSPVGDLPRCRVIGWEIAHVCYSKLFSWSAQLFQTNIVPNYNIVCQHTVTCWPIMFQPLRLFVILNPASKKITYSCGLSMESNSGIIYKLLLFVLLFLAPLPPPFPLHFLLLHPLLHSLVLC